MTTNATSIEAHYEAGSTPDELIARIAAKLATMGEDSVTAVQLASLDQFHVRGLAATRELAELVAPTAALRVLDAGSGLGGPSRYLAETYGCDVRGVDLTPSYVAVASYLARRSGAADRLAYEVGDLLDLPGAAGQFDLVWSQHVMMNVHERLRAYRQCHRVLADGGRFACYDIVAAPGKPDIPMPMPWASSAAASHLLTAAETIMTLEQAGFTLLRWIDVTAAALDWFNEPAPAAGRAPGLAVIMGPGAAAMGANMARSLREGRLALGMGVFAKTADVQSADANTASQAPQ